MELWIRSQDKMELAKFDLLTLEDVPGSEEEYMFIADHYKNMGVYKTAERALEVLDEIQKSLMTISECKQEADNLIISFKNIDTVVYEMSKE